MSNEVGCPMSLAELATRSNRELVQNINRSIRTDFGGVPNVEQLIVRKLTQASQTGVTVDRETLLEILAQEVHRLIRQQVEGIRSRTAHDREELLRRFVADLWCRAEASEDEQAGLRTLERPINTSTTNTEQIESLQNRVKLLEEKLISRVDLFNVLRLKDKINGILTWARNHPESEFNSDFVEDLNAKLLSRGYLSVKQEQALDNITKRWLKNRRHDEGDWDSGAEYDHYPDWK